MSILAIDPGNEESAYVLIDSNFKPLNFGKISNDELLSSLKHYPAKEAVIEMIACYGMPVGEEVFETCVWVGRFLQELSNYNIPVSFVYRKDVKMHICETMRAKDANVRQVLIDRFGQVGTKKNPGWFYGFKSDVWAAYAVGVTYKEISGVNPA